VRLASVGRSDADSANRFANARRPRMEYVWHFRHWSITMGLGPQIGSFRTEMAKRKISKRSKTSQRKGGSALPKVVAIVACDGIQRDATTGKHSLIGVFGSRVVRRGAPLRPFGVYIKLADVSGKLIISYEIEAPLTRLRRRMVRLSRLDRTKR
jgi:hypothetical protein